MPVSVLVVHSSLRSGLMVENISAQLGEFFGVKDGKGVLVRSVEKGSRGEKAGFRAGDVVIRVNSQVVHDTADYTHALRTSSGKRNICNRDAGEERAESYFDSSRAEGLRQRAGRRRSFADMDAISVEMQNKLSTARGRLRTQRAWGRLSRRRRSGRCIRMTRT